MTGALLLAAPLLAGEDRGIEHVTIDQCLARVGAAQACHFSLELLSINAAENPPAQMPVDFGALRPETDVPRFLQLRFPAYRVEAVAGRPRCYRVYHVRLLQARSYPLEEKLTAFSYRGTQSEFIGVLAGRVRGLSAFAFAAPWTSYYTASSSPMRLTDFHGPVREAFACGHLRGRGESRLALLRCRHAGRLESQRGPLRSPVLKNIVPSSPRPCLSCFAALAIHALSLGSRVRFAAPGPL